MKIVLDSNILLVVIGKRSRYRPIWTSFIDGEYDLIVSEDVIFEYEEILQQHSAPGIDSVVMEILLRLQT